VTVDVAYTTGLLTELRKMPKETGWLEFKVNNEKPEDTSTHLSALSNTAALQGKTTGYVVWGVENETHAVKALKANAWWREARAELNALPLGAEKWRGERKVGE
jgi:hypothetical protein